MEELKVAYDRSHLNKLMKKIDVNDSKNMTYDEFVRLIRGQAE